MAKLTVELSMRVLRVRWFDDRRWEVLCYCKMGNKMWHDYLTGVLEEVDDPADWWKRQ